MRYVLMLIMLFLALSAWCNVNLNTATAAEIAEELVGIGEQKAEAIVKYRKTHGPFKSLRELYFVKGIGPKTLNKNKNRITLK